MKVLITGISGMLGVDLYRTLKGEYQLVGLDTRDFPSVSFASPPIHKVDITDFKAIKELFHQLIPDFVIHAAAYTDVDGCEKSPDKAHKINAVGTQNVALYCWKFGIPLIYISTDFVFGGDEKVPYVEFDEPCPLNVYGRSKLAGENHVKSLLYRFFIVRTSWLYGPYGKNFVKTILRLAGEKSELKVVNDQVGSPTYTWDLAQQIKKLLLAYEKLVSSSAEQIRSSGAIHGTLSDKSDRYNTIDGSSGAIHGTRSRGFSPVSHEPEGSTPEDKALEIEQRKIVLERELNKLYGIYHITNSGSCSWYEFAQEILRLAGIKGVRLIPITSKELTRPASRPKFSVLDNHRLKQKTGGSMRQWKEALGDYFEDQKGNK